MNSEILSNFPLPEKSAADRPNTDACTVRVLSSTAEIEEFRVVWTGWQDHRNADLDYFLMVNQLRKQVVRPHVILVLCGGNPKAMAIGRIERDSVVLKFGYKSIAHFPVLTLHLIHGGLLGEQTAEATGTILTSLKQTLRSGEADMLALNFMPVESEIVQRLPEKVSFLCREHFTGKNTHWKMTLGCSVEEMYARLSRDHRQQLRRKAKTVEKDFSGALAIRCFREPAELQQMMADVEEIAKTTYQRGLGVGFMDTEECRKRIAFEASQGWLRMYVLYLKGKPCAYWWATLYHNTFNSHALGFDTDYGKYSPGTYLVSKIMEDLCRQGVENLDFGIGEAQYKRQFGTRRVDEIFINVCAARPRLIALNLMKTLNNGVKTSALAIAGRFNIVQTVKKRWRTKLAPKKVHIDK